MIRLNTSQNQQTRLWVTLFALVLSWTAPGSVLAQSNQLQDIEVQTLAQSGSGATTQAERSGTGIR